MPADDHLRHRARPGELLAAPFAVLAGAAITELTISIAMAISDGLRRPDDSGRPARGGDLMFSITIMIIVQTVVADRTRSVQPADFRV